MFGFYRITNKDNPSQEQELKKFHYYKIKYTIDDLNWKKFEIKNIVAARGHAKILVIDDQDFPLMESLRGSYHYNIAQDYVGKSSYIAAEYDIILCDIHGVAKEMRSEYGGAPLSQEIKTTYPNKKVVAYSAAQFDPAMSDYLDYADKRMGKSTTSDDWVAVLDQLIEQKFDLKDQWKITRHALLKQGVSIADVACLESKYVESVNNKSVVSFQNQINNASFAGAKLIVDLLQLTVSSMNFLQTAGLLL